MKAPFKTETSRDTREAAETFRALGDMLAPRCSCGCRREIRNGDQTENMADGRVLLATCYHAAAGPFA
jgi:hypothetical protein